MPGKRLIWRIYYPYILIIIASLAATAWYSSKSLKDLYLDKTASDLEARAILLTKQFAPYLKPPDAMTINSLCREFGAETSMRITVILPNGVVLGDSDKDPLTMDNHADRPEVIEALRSGEGSSVRFSHTLKEQLMYFALPARVDGKIAGVVRASIPITHVNMALRKIYAEIAVAGLAIAFLAALVSLAISRRISRPLDEIKRGAQRFAKGDLGHKLAVRDTDVIGDLADAMNSMAEELDERISAVVQQRNEFEAVLSSMVESVLAVDRDERIMSINQACMELLGIGAPEPLGKSAREVVRNGDLRRFLAKVFSTREPLQDEMIFLNGEERCLQAHGTPLKDQRGEAMGALVVLNDITDIRRLENMRRDFVANVSHELKTPITSIKGFVETLLDGAMKAPEDLERFLHIIFKQTNRLNSIIEDLLAISRLEQDETKSEMAFETIKLLPVLKSAVQLCDDSAQKKSIAVALDVDDEISARINSTLIEQAVVNLVDNAIKYSDEGGDVSVKVSQKGDEVVIVVKDNGAGIKDEHLQRLFERFYRVDKARSRSMGGTGLGLAIVKHIAQVHGGGVSVESKFGAGSVFSIHLSAR